MSEAGNASISDRIGDILALSPKSIAIDFNGEVTSWGAIAKAAEAIECELRRAGVSPDAPIGWLAVNAPAAIIAFAALLRFRRPIVPLRTIRPIVNCTDDIRDQRLMVIIGDAESWNIADLVSAAGEAGSVAVRIGRLATDLVDCVPGLERPGPGPFRASDADFVMERMSSGTTGPPKRIPVTEEALLAGLRGAEETERSTLGKPLSLKTSPAFITMPLSHAAGMSTLLSALYQGRPVVLFEKFDVEKWLGAVRTYRPKATTLVPTMIKMILCSDASREDLSSIRAVRAGTAPLDPADRLAFEDRFGVPILIDYGATEFVGGVAAWTLQDHRRYRISKSGSVGFPRRGVEVRAIDPDTGDLVAPDEVGQLQIKSARFGPDWITTMDWASLDADGFLYIHGRVDDAIIRGGFKILPDAVSAVLRQFPGVSDAEVIGMPDEKLGQVPVAAIEIDGADIVIEELREFAREHLISYQVPVEFRIVDRLPRTATLKVSRPELRKMLHNAPG